MLYTKKYNRNSWLPSWESGENIVERRLKYVRYFFDEKLWDLPKGRKFEFTDLYTEEELKAEPTGAHIALGRMFYSLYKVGYFNNVICLGKNSQNHRVYQIV